MKQTLKQIKISDIPDALQRLGISQDTTINLTIETIEEEQEDILTLFQQIGQEAQAKGLTEEILEELLATES
jgi:ACT domain-containing protein